MPSAEQRQPERREAEELEARRALAGQLRVDHEVGRGGDQRQHAADQCREAQRHHQPARRRAGVLRDAQHDRDEDGDHRRSSSSANRGRPPRPSAGPAGGSRCCRPWHRASRRAACATPVRTRPSPMTNRAAMRTMDESLKPASASFMVTMPVSGSATITISATASMRGRLITNITIAAASRTRTRARSVFIERLRKRGGRRGSARDSPLAHGATKWQNRIDRPGTDEVWPASMAGARGLRRGIAYRLPADEAYCPSRGIGPVERGSHGADQHCARH